jgi:hypothetical protein
MPLPNSSYNLVTGNNFRIIRSPQIIPMQEETFFQPDNGPSIGININDGSNNQIVLNNDMILFLPTGTIINSPSGTMILTVTQDAIDPNGSPETADVFLDCMSGTNRYISPN